MTRERIRYLRNTLGRAIGTAALVATITIFALAATVIALYGLWILIVMIPSMWAKFVALVWVLVFVAAFITIATDV